MANADNSSTEAQLSHLLTVNRRLSEILDASEALDYVLDEVLKLVDAEQGFIVLVTEEGTFDIRAARDISQPGSTLEFQRPDGVSHSILNQVLESGESLLVEDAMFDPRFSDQQSIQSMRLRSIMSVPLKTRNRVTGSIYVENRAGGGKFSRSDLAPLEFFSQNVASTIEKANLYSKVEQLVDEQARSLTELQLTHQQLQNEMASRQQVEEQLRIAQKLESLGLLTGGIAHDFSNIMSVITLNTELMLAQASENDWFYKSLEDIEEVASFGTSMVRQLAAFSRQQELKPTRVDVNELILSMTGMLRTLDQNISIDYDLASDLRSVWIDESQLRQVIMNLVINARDAMPQGGTITITTHAEHLGDESTVSLPPLQGDIVRLSIADTGTGISKEHLERIFEPFFSTKNQSEGTGLGLATVYGIINQSGGLIEVASEVGLGTCFDIYLPCFAG